MPPVRARVYTHYISSHYVAAGRSVPKPIEAESSDQSSSACCATPPPSAGGEACGAHCLLTHSHYCRVLPRGKCGCRRTMEFLQKESNPSRGHQRFREKTDETAPLLCGPRIRNYLVLPPIANRRATQAALLVLRPHPPIPGTILLFGKKAYIPKIRARSHSSAQTRTQRSTVLRHCASSTPCHCHRIERAVQLFK